MFEDCHVRIGSAPFATCVPLTAAVLSRLHVLPLCEAVPAGPVLQAWTGEGFAEAPWRASLAVAPEETSAAVLAGLRALVLATPDGDPARLQAGLQAAAGAGQLPAGSRVARHAAALVALWQAHPRILPADLATLIDFLRADAASVLQPATLVAPIAPDSRHTPLERAVLARLAALHGQAAAEDPDHLRLIDAPRRPAAPAATRLGHVQRTLLDPAALPLHGEDDSLAVLSVRDARAEAEAAAAIVQGWLAADPGLRSADVAVVVPQGSSHAAHLAAAFAMAGLVPSGLPHAGQPPRNIGAETVLHFLMTRQRPAPTMALAAFLASPLLTWSPALGLRLARAALDGRLHSGLAEGEGEGAGALLALARAGPPETVGQLVGQLRALGRHLRRGPAWQAEREEALAHIIKLCARASEQADDAEPDWNDLLARAARWGSMPAQRGPVHVGGVPVLVAGEVPPRPLRKLLLLGFNAGTWPGPVRDDPFFLDSERALLASAAGITLAAPADRVDHDLAALARTLGRVEEQAVLLLSERDGQGAALSPSGALPLLARLVGGSGLVVPHARGAGTVWARLLPPAEPARNTQMQPAAQGRADLPAETVLDCDLLGLRRNAEGDPAAQSPSRLETLLVSPLAWVLEEMGATHAPWQPDGLDIMLRGTLAHGVFETVFPRGNTPRPDEARAAVPAALAACIARVAPHLAAPGWLVERRALTTMLGKAAAHWAQVLEALGARIVGNEFWLEGELAGHPIRGKADCLLCLPDGQPVVVDFKTGGARRRRTAMQAGWDLQVELYRTMRVRLTDESDAATRAVAEALAAWRGPVAVAYHMLTDGTTLLNGVAGLDAPQLDIVPGAIAEAALAMIAQRMAALREGRIALNTTADADHCTALGLGGYALSRSPLITACLRDDARSILVPEAE